MVETESHCWMYLCCCLQLVFRKCCSSSVPCVCVWLCVFCAGLCLARPGAACLEQWERGRARPRRVPHTSDVSAHLSLQTPSLRSSAVIKPCAVLRSSRDCAGSAEPDAIPGRRAQRLSLKNTNHWLLWSTERDRRHLWRRAEREDCVYTSYM